MQSNRQLDSRQVGAVAANLLFYLPVGEGNHIGDVSGNGNHGFALSGNIKVGDGVAGGDCLEFSSSQSLMELPKAVIVEGNLPRTICHYIKRKVGVDLNGENYAFGFGMYLAARTSAIAVDTDLFAHATGSDINGRTFNSRFGGGKYGFMGHAMDHDNYGTADINDENTPAWHFSCFSYDGTTVRSWVDGSLNWEWAAALNTDASSANAKAYISSHDGYTALSANALIDEFRVYNRVITTAEMETIRCEPFTAAGIICPSV